MLSIQFQVLFYKSLSTIMKNIGNYVIVQCHEDCGIGIGKQKYILSSQHQYYVGIAQPLSSEQITSLSKGHLSQVIHSDNLIREVLLTVQNDRRYLMVVEYMDKAKPKRIVNIQNVDISPPECIRLMVEGLLMIEGIHRIGAMLAQDMMNYLQFQHLDFGKIKAQFFKLQDYGNQGTAKKKQELAAQMGDVLNCQESQLLLSFYQLLTAKFLKSLQNLPPSVQKATSLIRNAIKLKRQISSIQILNTLVMLQIKQSTYSFISHFNPKSSEITITVTSSDRQIYSYFPITTLKIENTSEKIPSIDFYYSLAAHPTRAKIISASSITFFDWYKFRERNILLQNAIVSKPQKETTFDMNSDKQSQVEEQINMNDYVQEASISPNRSSLAIKCETFPGNCIVRILSCFQIQGKQQQMKGVGFLIDSHLVITCAHLLCQVQNKVFYQATSVLVVTQHENIETTYMYPHERNDTSLKQCKRRWFDYGLLCLKKPIVLPKYLQIAKNYRTDSSVYFTKVSKSNCQSIIRLMSKEHNFPIKNQKILEHPFKTKPGDSGSPIIVQFLQRTFDYFVISMHLCTNQKTQERSGLMFTDQVLQGLSKFQYKLRKGHYSWIKHMAIEYESLKKWHKQFQKEHEAKFKTQNAQLKRRSRFHQLSNLQQMVMNKNGLIPRVERTLKAISIVTNYSIFINNLYIFKQSQNEQLKHQKQLLLVEIERFKQQYLQPYQDDQAAQFKANMDVCFLNIKERKQYSINYLSLWQKYVTDYSCLLEHYKVKWQIIAIYYKYRQCTNLLQAQHFYLFRHLDIPRAFKELNMMTKKNYQLIILDLHWLFHLDLCKYWLGPFVKFHHPKQRQFFPPQLIPFSSFRSSGLCKTQSEHKRYQYQYIVTFSDSPCFFQYCWQQIKIIWQQYPFVYLNRIVKQQTNCYQLKVTFVTFCSMTLKQYLASLTDNFLGELLTLLMDFSRYVGYLHSEGLILGAPIEFCCLFRQLQSVLYLCYFYFGHPQTLKNKFKGIQNRISREQLQEIKQYYPLKEIVNNSGVQAFKKIDIFMLGKSIQKLLSMMNIPLYYANEPKYQQIQQKLCQMVSLMVCQAPQQRIDIQGVKTRISFVYNKFVRN